MSVRVRFAPSPTGYLHIGGARTALFNWLFARHHGGTFILRIEDTDEARNSQEAIQVILDSLTWLGLDWDEGPLTANPQEAGKGDKGPYFQSARSSIYQSYVEKLLAADKAYESEGAIKFRMAREMVEIPDLVIGNVERKLTDREELDPDFVIVRSDGKPTFHLANVVDDLEMGLTHVIRGEDHLSNTSKHIKLFEALGEKPPHYAHIPLILNPNGSKMSKRDEGASLTTYMDRKFVPEAVINFLALLGWSSKTDQDIFSSGQLIEKFDIPGILRANSKFDMVKMEWFNAEHMKSLSDDDLVSGCLPYLQEQFSDVDSYSKEYTSHVILTCREKLKMFSDISSCSGFFFQKELEFAPEEVSKQLNEKNLPVIQAVRGAFGELEDYTSEAIQDCMKSVATELEIKPGKVMGPTRLAVTASKTGPGVTDIISILGKERVLKNIDSAIQYIQESSSNG